jgi:polyhydroxybutyrate depolymerase
MRNMRRRRLLRVTGLVAFLALVAICLVGFLATNPYTACLNSAAGPPRPGTSARSLVSGGLERCYLLHVPPAYDPERPLPLIISLPGFLSNPHGQEFLTRWNDVADAENLLVAYPQGTSFPLRWNASTTFENSPVDDVQFIADLITELSAMVPVDPAHIYVNGMSNGGSMANRVACELADEVAAVGVVTGPPVEPPGGCSPARPIPLIAFYGTDDPLVSYDGGAPADSFLSRLLDRFRHRASFPPVASWIEGWAERNGCAPEPEPLPAQADVSGVRYGDCDDEVEIVFYTVEGGGHTWPGGRPTLVGKTSKDIWASQVMWEFFARHPLPAKP